MTNWTAYSTDPISAALVAQLPPGRTTMLKGIDISNNNGTIDWPLLARYAPDFVLMKASEGTNYTDSFFANNWKEAQAYGIPRGAYHFCRPSSNSGHAEAEYYLSVVQSAGGFQSGDIPIIDMEDNKVAFNADLLAYETDFYSIADPAVGAPTVQYSSLSYMLAHNLTGHASLANHGLWLADWQTSHLPGVPAPWTVFAFWQYDDVGKVPGVAGPCLMDLFNGTAQQLRLYGKP